MKNKLKPAVTFQQLKDALENATPEQLIEPVRWWGEDRGGVIQDIFLLEQDYILTDEGYEPLPVIEDSFEPDGDVLPQGTIILCTDEYEVEEKEVNNE